MLPAAYVFPFFFCHHPTERSLQTARFWAGCALSFPPFENRLVHSSPYYSSYLTSSMELRARESRCLAQTDCMYTWSSGRAVHRVVGDLTFCLCFLVWWTGDNTNVTDNDIGISDDHGFYYCRAVNYISSGCEQCGRYQWLQFCDVKSFVFIVWIPSPWPWGGLVVSWYVSYSIIMSRLSLETY